jgi:hypothetical protein
MRSLNASTPSRCTRAGIHVEGEVPQRPPTVWCPPDLDQEHHAGDADLLLIGDDPADRLRIAEMAVGADDAPDDIADAHAFAHLGKWSRRHVFRIPEAGCRDSGRPVPPGYLARQAIAQRPRFPWRDALCEAYLDRRTTPALIATLAPRCGYPDRRPQRAPTRERELRNDPAFS